MDKFLWAEGEARSYHIVWIFKYVQKIVGIYRKKIAGIYRRIYKIT